MYLLCDPKYTMPNQQVPVLILINGEWRIAQRIRDVGSYEESYAQTEYWDCPYNDGQEWHDEDITAWTALPVIERGKL